MAQGRRRQLATEHCPSPAGRSRVPVNLAPLTRRAALLFSFRGQRVYQGVSNRQLVGQVVRQPNQRRRHVSSGAWAATRQVPSGQLKPVRTIQRVHETTDDKEAHVGGRTALLASHRRGERRTQMQDRWSQHVVESRVCGGSESSDAPPQLERRGLRNARGSGRGLDARRAAHTVRVH